MTILEEPSTEPDTESLQTSLGVEPPGEPTERAEQPSKPRRKRRRMVAIVLLLLLVPTGWSYGGYLTADGDAPVGVRSVDWLRDHGFESVVNQAEQWWYTRSAPSGTTAVAEDIVSTGPVATPVSTHPDQVQSTVAPPEPVVPDVIAAQVTPAQPGEGVWQQVNGLATLTGVEQTFIRPDVTFPSVAVDLVRFDQSAVSLVYAPGTREPSGGPWAWGSRIPTNQRSHAVAAFNAGFKFKHTPGGVFTEGHEAVRPLEDGLAAAVIYKDGTTDIVQWGRDAQMSPEVVSVRQNLALIVDGGRPVDGLNTSARGKWGSTKSQLQYTSRSGLGVDAKGRLIYAAGRKMTVAQLASALTDAGAVRAMQLDIHNSMVSFNWYRPDPASSSGVQASKLIQAMKPNATRYLSSDQRDFFTVVAR